MGPDKSSRRDGLGVGYVDSRVASTVLLLVSSHTKDASIQIKHLVNRQAGKDGGQVFLQNCRSNSIVTSACSSYGRWPPLNDFYLAVRHCFQKPLTICPEAGNARPGRV